MRLDELYRELCEAVGEGKAAWLMNKYNISTAAEMRALIASFR